MSNNTRAAYQAGVDLAHTNFMNKLADVAGQAVTETPLQHLEFEPVTITGRRPSRRRGPSLNQLIAGLPANSPSVSTNMMLDKLRAARAGTAPKLRANPTMPNLRGMKMPEMPQMIQMDPSARYR